MQTGNAFDYSILLVSLLRGVGYDAYVVSGYASRDITLMDGSRVDTSIVGLPDPYNPASIDDAIAAAAEDEKTAINPANKDKYKIKQIRQLKSQFLVRQEQKKKLQEEKAAKEKIVKEEKAREVRIFTPRNYNCLLECSAPMSTKTSSRVCVCMRGSLFCRASAKSPIPSSSNLPRDASTT
jgi:hypothetical protein